MTNWVRVREAQRNAVDEHQLQIDVGGWGWCSCGPALMSATDYSAHLYGHILAAQADAARPWWRKGPTA